ncbi:MAG: polyprenyl synthetase family protein [Lachnospiraceae bacterium]|nr:polyprenyl synthetase family protein [Lachnospiraceae bacterium]
MAGKKVERDLAAFTAFYSESLNRLEKKTNAYNKSLRKEPNPIIRPFREDLADLNSGGKMLRGMLVNLGYRIAVRMNGDPNPDIGESDMLALAFEVFQTGVLVHDDIIDNAGTRRGKITIHRRYEHRLEVRETKMVAAGEKPGNLAKSVAICVGDLGIYYANRLIADSYADNPRLSELVRYFDDIVIQTIRGELLDVVLPYEIQDEKYSPDQKKKLLEKSIWDIYYLKTAGYSVIGPLHLGMILGGANEDQMKALDKVAEDIGIAYQIMDDILGIYADPEKLGKDVGSDITEFKQTILYMYVCAMKPEYEEELLKIYGKKRITDAELDEVQRIFRESGALDYAREMLGNCFGRAERRLARIKGMQAEDKAILRGFITYCKGRRK